MKTKLTKKGKVQIGNNEKWTPEALLNATIFKKSEIKPIAGPRVKRTDSKTR